ncbi:MAG: hypothetical protein CMO01_01070 [Thalassobius sp.]|nr:hypothetical protein [Thalassovita sp.]
MKEKDLVERIISHQKVEKKTDYNKVYNLFKSELTSTRELDAVLVKMIDFELIDYNKGQIYLTTSGKNFHSFASFEKHLFYQKIFKYINKFIIWLSILITFLLVLKK